MTIQATITVKEISQRLRLSETVVYRMLQDGTIPRIRPGGKGKWLVSRKRYEEWESTFGNTESLDGSRGEGKA